MNLLRRYAVFALALTFAGLVAHRVWKSADVTMMHSAPPDQRVLQELYFSPGGRYLASDIATNGYRTPWQKYPAFQAEHAPAQPRETICPITRTRANPACTWTIGDREYQFCCPPCIDEFVRMAKQQPAKILPPEQYLAEP